MSSEISGSATFIKNQQPHPERIHCRSHAINVPITFASKSQINRTIHGQSKHCLLIFY